MKLLCVAIMFVCFAFARSRTKSGPPSCAEMKCPKNMHCAEYFKFPVCEDDVDKSVECYSCMSPAYKDAWDNFEAIYNLPHSFTDRCNDPFSSQDIGTVNCTSICVTLIEPQFEKDEFMEYTFIRGCLDKLLRDGSNQPALSTHRSPPVDMCRNLPRPRAELSNHHQNDEVQLCSCYGDRCNGANPGHRLNAVNQVKNRI